MFTVDDRQRLLDRLISAARADARISGAALTGSGALGREDRWSDIDLALCISAEADRAAVIAAWTDRMYGEHAAVHHLDVAHGEALYRVFLLGDTLQVDLSFWPEAEFGATGPSFRLLFGTAVQRAAAPVPTVAELTGTGWLYALHARSSIARGRAWQAEYMISGARDQVLALACLRHELPTAHGRGTTAFRRTSPSPSSRRSCARSTALSSSARSRQPSTRCSWRSTMPTPPWRIVWCGHSDILRAERRR